MERFLKLMPKVELHAHLNGSLKISSIHELGAVLYGKTTKEFILLCEKFIAFDGHTELEECFQKFKFMHQLTATKLGLRLATELIIRDFAKENVMYLELRSTPKANDQMSKREYLEIVLDAITSASKEHKGISVKFLPSIDRSKSVADGADTLRTILLLRSLYPTILAGIDFSGRPTCGHFKDFKDLLQLVRENGLPLAMHCAEIDNPTEIEEMLEFGMERCGHGTFLSAAQIEELGNRHIAIECCLTSNVKCGTVRSYSDHHFRRMFDANQDAPAVVLCTDDAGVFNTTLTRELLLAAETFNLTKDDFYKLSLNAIEHAFTNEDEKQAMIARISKYFTQ